VDYSNCLVSTNFASQSLKVGLEANSSALAQLDQRTTLMYDMLNQLLSIMPKALGYPWEGGNGPEDKPLRLLDALGRDLMIPTIFLGSREV
jgi:hypothetical protein